MELFELFRNTGGVGGGVETRTVAAHIGLVPLPVGDPVLLLASAGQEESHHQEPEDDNLCRRPSQSVPQ